MVGAWEGRGGQERGRDMGWKVGGESRALICWTSVPHVVWSQQIQDVGNEFWPILIEQVRGTQHFTDRKLLQSTAFDKNQLMHGTRLHKKDSDITNHGTILTTLFVDSVESTVRRPPKVRQIKVVLLHKWSFPQTWPAHHGTYTAEPVFVMIHSCAQNHYFS